MPTLTTSPDSASGWASYLRARPDDFRRAVLPLLRQSDWAGRFLPHHFRDPPSEFHRDLDALLHRSPFVRGWRRAFLAPRESAKSTWLTLGYVLRCAVVGWEPYTLI